MTLDDLERRTQGIQERVKLRTSFGRYINRVHPNKSPLNIWEKKGAWAYLGTAQSF